MPADIDHNIAPCTKCGILFYDQSKSGVCAACAGMVLLRPLRANCSHTFVSDPQAPGVSVCKLCDGQHSHEQHLAQKSATTAAQRKEELQRQKAERAEKAKQRAENLAFAEDCMVRNKEKKELQKKAARIRLDILKLQVKIDRLQEKIRFKRMELASLKA